MSSWTEQLDESLKLVGSRGYYHTILFYFICIPAAVPSAFLAFSQFNLVCEDSWWPRTTTTLFWVGSLFGNVLFGWVSDKWGRRSTIMLLLALEVPLSMIICFIPDYMSYTILRTISGIFFPALFQIPLILALELMPPKNRTHAGIMIAAFFASATSILAVLGYLLRDWFKLSLATSIPFVVLFSNYWILPESPRWLVSKGRVKEAENILIHMAKKNGIVLERGFLRKLHEEGKLINGTENDVKEIKASDKIQIDTVENNTNAEIVFNQSERVTREPFIRANFLALSETLKKIDENDVETNSIDEGIQIEMRDVKGTTTIDYSQCIDTSQYIGADKHEADGIGCRTDLGSNQKSTQTEPFTCRPNAGFRKRSTDFVTRLLGRDGIEASTARLDEECSEIEEEATPMDLIRNPNIRKKFFILTFDWITNGLVYNGLSYNTTNLGVSEYLAFFIGGVVELPSYAVVWLLMDKYGRKWVMCTALAIAGLSCICCMFVPDDQVWVTVTLAMIGKFGIAGAFAIFYVFVGELLPTVLRAQAMGLASFLAGVGLLAFPYVVHLAVYWKVLPLILMGVLALTASVISLFLPETLNAPLPQTVKEGELFGKDYPIFSCKNPNDSPETKA